MTINIVRNGVQPFLLRRLEDLRTHARPLAADLANTAGTIGAGYSNLYLAVLNFAFAMPNADAEFVRLTSTELAAAP